MTDDDKKHRRVTLDLTPTGGVFPTVAESEMVDPTKWAIPDDGYSCGGEHRLPFGKSPNLIDVIRWEQGAAHAIDSRDTALRAAQGEIERLEGEVKQARETAECLIWYSMRRELDQARTALADKDVEIERLTSRVRDLAAAHCDGCKYDPETNGHEYHELCAGCSRYYSDNIDREDVRDED